MEVCVFFYLTRPCKRDLKIFKIFQSKSWSRNKEKPALRGKVRAESSAKSRHWKHSARGKQPATNNSSNGFKTASTGSQLGKKSLNFVSWSVLSKGFKSVPFLFLPVHGWYIHVYYSAFRLLIFFFWKILVRIMESHLNIYVSEMRK